MEKRVAYHGYRINKQYLNHDVEARNYISIHFTFITTQPSYPKMNFGIVTKESFCQDEIKS